MIEHKVVDGFIPEKKRLAIIGAGPAGLYLYKALLESSLDFYKVDIFEAGKQPGMGMPYSARGANAEHITNVSGNEVPPLVTSVVDWIQTVPKSLLDQFSISREDFHEYQVLPRLLFGEYLKAQFELLRAIAAKSSIDTRLLTSTQVTNITDLPNSGWVMVECDRSFTNAYHHVFICTGHHWPVSEEGKTSNYFDSPYPPSKLLQLKNQSVAIRGSGLTAIDAVRTLARNNGRFIKSDDKLRFLPDGGCTDFHITLHSLHGLLPAIRFHLEDPTLSTDPLIPTAELNAHIKANNGFLSLDFIFEKDFKEVLLKKDPALYGVMKDMTMEQFVDTVMNSRERKDAFELFKAEYREAAISIEKHQSIYWKELLAILSFAMNYPAKYFSAEDTIRLKKTLMPLISIVIAFVPQSSCEELIALHDAGLLDLTAVDEDSVVEPIAAGGINYHYVTESGKQEVVRFNAFIDCIGQPRLSKNELCFPALLENRSVVDARIKFRSSAIGATLLREGNDKVVQDISGDYYLHVPGIAISDNFNIIGETGESNPRIFMMAVPYIGGFNPDYSGLDFCEAASAKIVSGLAAYNHEQSVAQQSRGEKIPEAGRA